MNLSFLPEVIILLALYTGVKLGYSYEAQNHGLWAFQNRVLQIIFGHEGKEITRD
jgi:hypothetical protein